jgi:c-di-GMP-binding flagellar brake protein YcgR
MAKSLEIIDSPDIISATLETLLDKRSNLSITPPGTKDFFTSFILKVENDSLHIDQVMPLTGNILFKPGQTLNIRLSYKNISYRFESKHLSYSVDDSGFNYHKITLPAQIQYLEKRLGYRINLKLSESQPIQISIPPEEFCDASLVDISQGGACIRLKGNHLLLETCNVIDCNLQIANSAPLVCQAVIKHYQYSKKTNETKAGIEFCQLSPSAEKQLQKLLMQLQRRNIRTDLTL